MTGTPTWDDLPELHRFLAELDTPDPWPHLLGFRGDQLLVAVRLRTFAPGGYHGPLVEAMALALPLGSDRLSVGMPARAWSMLDPVVPVSDDGDLRQRVLMQVTVDGHGIDPPTTLMALHPFAADDDLGLVWSASLDPGPGEGWIPHAMATCVAGRDEIGADRRPGDVDRQRRRLERLGHLVVLTEHGQVRCAP